jgi:hypothetical protein
LDWRIKVFWSFYLDFFCYCQFGYEHFGIFLNKKYYLWKKWLAHFHTSLHMGGVYTLQVTCVASIGGQMLFSMAALEASKYPL